MSLPFKLLLASSSPYRAKQLETLNIPFDTIQPNIDETPRMDETPQRLVARLSEEKARSGLKLGDNTASYVIGSDQVSVLNDQIIGKPGTLEKAREQLSHASGKTLCFLTGLCLIDMKSGETKHYLETTEVTFRPLSPDQIERYLSIEQPFDCAGSFKSEKLGVSLIQNIKGRDPNALIGLPLMGLIDLLSQFDVQSP